MKQLTLTDIRHLMTDRIGFLSQRHAEDGSLLHYAAMGTELFVASDPHMLTEILVKHSGCLQRDYLTGTIIRRIVGQGVFTAEGPTWRQQRKMVQPAFHALRIRDYTETMAHYTREMVAAWQPEKPFALDQTLAQLTLRIIAKTMYGVDLQDDVAKIGRDMSILSSIAERQLQAGYLAPEWMPSISNLRHKWAKWRIRSLLHRIVKQRQASGQDKGDLLSMILNARDDSGNPMSDTQIIDELMTVFFAGQDTTSAALTWVWHLLLTHPEAISKLQNEVSTILGNEAVSFEALAQMPYAEAVIKEALRLYPPAPFVARLINQPFTVGDTHFPQNCLLFLNIYELHRRSDLFSDPTSFNPDRFLTADKLPHRNAYMPFSVGPRVCLGNMFVMLEARVILATMIQHVQLQRTTHAPVVLDTKITLRPRDPLLVTVAANK